MNLSFTKIGSSCFGFLAWKISSSFSLDELHCRCLLAQAKSDNPINFRSTYLARVSTVCKLPCECNNSSQTEFAKRLPSDLSILKTEESQTLTSSVSDLTCQTIFPNLVAKVRIKTKGILFFPCTDKEESNVRFRC